MSIVWGNILTVEPIHTLPEDILSLMINARCEDEALPDAIWCALGLSHVCAYWRRVALHDAAIWSRFDTGKGHPHLVNLFFERSRGHLKSLRHSWDSFVDIVPASDRLEELDLVMPNPALFHDFWAGEEFFAPELRAFSLCLKAETFGTSRGIDGPRLLAKAPHIRRLTLSQCQWFCDGALPTCTSLTSIQFHSSSLYPDSLAGIIHLLRASPQLVEIDIECASHTKYGGSPVARLLSGEARISLERLCTFKLDIQPTSDLITLLGMITIPDTAHRVSIAAGGQGRSGFPRREEIQELLHRQLLPPALLRGSHSISVEVTRIFRICLSHAVLICWKGVRQGIEFCVEISWHVSGSAYRTPLADILATLPTTHPLDEITTVSLAAGDRYSSPVGRGLVIPMDFMVHLPSLTAVHIWEWREPCDFLDRLVQLQTAHGPTLWPHLRSVSLSLPHSKAKNRKAVFVLCSKLPVLQYVDICVWDPNKVEGILKTVRYPRNSKQPQVWR